MKKLELKSRQLLRTLFGCISLTAVAFVFQACYGPEPDLYYDIKLTGTVKSKNTQMPIKGIKVAVNVDIKGFGNNIFSSGMTNEEGKFDFYATVPGWGYYFDEDGIRYPPDSVKVKFLDIDSLENGYFEDKVIFINPAHKDEVKIHVELDPKQ